jgi:ABC-type spermidine/putrescine transport system permease subunit I
MSRSSQDIEAAPAGHRRCISMAAAEPLLLMLPIALVMIVPFLVPLLGVIVTSMNGPDWSPSAFAKLYRSRLFQAVLVTTIEISIYSTLLAIALGYPIALHLTSVRKKSRTLLLVCVILPLWTSVLIKSFAFVVLLGQRGALNTALTSLFGENAAIEILYTRTATVIGMSHFLNPFIVLPSLSNLTAQPKELGTAARLCGASEISVFFRVTLPLSLPAVLSGAIVALVLSLGTFITPALLGGKRDMTIASLIDFYTRVSLDWNAAAASGVILLLICTGALACLRFLPAGMRVLG